MTDLPASLRGVTSAVHSTRHRRIEALLVAQMRLRHHPHVNPGHLFEVERAIDELTGGACTSHTETVERWACAFLAAPFVGGA